MLPYLICYGGVIKALGTGIPDSRPFAKNAKERGTHRVGAASEIKRLGHGVINRIKSL